MITYRVVCGGGLPQGENETMRKIDRVRLLEVLESIQQSSAPVTVQIGTSKDSFVDNSCVVIKSAPGIVIKDLAKLGYLMEVTSEGVKISYIEC